MSLWAPKNHIACKRLYTKCGSQASKPVEGSFAIAPLSCKLQMKLQIMLQTLQGPPGCLARCSWPLGSFGFVGLAGVLVVLRLVEVLAFFLHRESKFMP